MNLSLIHPPVHYSPCFASSNCALVALKTKIEKIPPFQTDIEKHRLRVEGLGVGEGKEVRNKVQLPKIWKHNLLLV